MKTEKKYILISALSLSTAVFIWWLCTDVLKLAPGTVLPSPVKVLSTFIKKLYDSAPDGATLIEHIGSSLNVAMTGYALGLIIGIPLGILMAWYDKVDMYVRPIFDLIRPIPGIAWVPFTILFFGIGIMSKASVVFLSAFVSCVINAYSGIRQTKSVHVWVGQTFGASKFEILWRVGIPSALPMILTGMRVALASAWTAIVAAELLASTRGLGFMIQQSRGIYRPDVIIAGMLAIGGIGSILTYLISLLEKRLLKGGRW